MADAKRKKPARKRKREHKKPVVRIDKETRAKMFMLYVETESIGHVAKAFGRHRSQVYRLATADDWELTLERVKEKKREALAARIARQEIKDIDLVDTLAKRIFRKLLEDGKSGKGPDILEPNPHHAVAVIRLKHELLGTLGPPGQPTPSTGPTSVINQTIINASPDELRKLLDNARAGIDRREPVSRVDLTGL